MSKLALFGGQKAVQAELGDVFTKIPSSVMKEMENVVLDVLRKWKMSDEDITMEFEKRYADWHGMKYGLGFSNGTASILAAMYGVGVGRGDEIICSTLTYWASCLQSFSLGATIVFADIDSKTLNIDPKDIEKKITDKTKAIIVVHYTGYPADMDAIMEIARKHDVKVIEDASHAHGALYKRRMVGTLGDVSAFSLMSGKSFSTGEAGILLTNDREIYERALIFGHYRRHNEITIEYLKEGIHLPWGGIKGRVNQMCSAIGLVQLKYYPEQIKEIDKAMNYFWDSVEPTPGVKSHRPPKDSETTKGGWYFPLGLYIPEELGGLSVTRFCEALRAEGVPSTPGCNTALHNHPLFNKIDVYNEGCPTRFVNTKNNINKLQGSLPVAEGIQEKVFSIPLFYRYRPNIIDEYVDAFKKVAKNYKELLPGDKGNPKEMSRYATST